MEEFSLYPACRSQINKPLIIYDRQFNYHSICKSSQSPQRPSISSRSQSRSPSSRPQSPRLQRCAWCDSHEHTKSACSEFQRVEMSGRVSVNDANRVKYWGTATELPQMIGKGAMKLVYKKLMELEEQLGLTRNYNPSCVNILHGVIRSFSA